MYLVKEKETGYTDGYYETYDEAWLQAEAWKKKRPEYTHVVLVMEPEYPETIPDEWFLPIRYAEDELERAEQA